MEDSKSRVGFCLLGTPFSVLKRDCETYVANAVDCVPSSHRPI